MSSKSRALLTRSDNISLAQHLGDMYQMSKLDVVVFKRDEWWVAQCLQYDIGAQAFTVDNVLYEFQRSVVGHLAICLQHGKQPFEGLDAAPEIYWNKFNSASTDLATRAPAFSSPAPALTPPQEYRLAA